MNLKYFIRPNVVISLLSLTFLFFYACSNIETINTSNSCKLFGEKKNWYKASKESFNKWGVPISLQLAIIYQESSFRQFVKPARKRFIGIIPGSRPSSAFGFAQITNPTWIWYKTNTGNKNASRANFKDVTDFIGWYVEKTNKMLGISKNDAYNQYLAYHEGHKGWKNKSFKTKNWLIEVAKNVEINSNMYNNQLKECKEQLDSNRLFGIF